MNLNTKDHAEELLRKALSERLETLKQTNPLYSLRAFARRSGLSPTTLSLFLNGKRRLSLEAATKIMTQIKLTEEDSLQITKGFVDRCPNCGCETTITNSSLPRPAIELNS